MVNRYIGERHWDEVGGQDVQTLECVLTLPEKAMWPPRCTATTVDLSIRSDKIAHCHVSVASTIHPSLKLPVPRCCADCAGLLSVLQSVASKYRLDRLIYPRKRHAYI